MYGSLALGAPGRPSGGSWTRSQAHPEWASGTTRDEVRLICGVPGLSGKGSAEGVYAVALDDGRAVALKIADGQSRPRPVVMAALLRRLGVNAAVLDELSRPPVLGHGEPVGEIRVSVGVRFA